MPRKPGHVPAYRLHKPSGQARVIIDGEHIYLGKFGTSESQEKYARLIAETAATGGRNVGQTRANGDPDSLNVEQLLAARPCPKNSTIRIPKQIFSNSV